MSDQIVDSEKVDQGAKVKKYLIPLFILLYLAPTTSCFAALPIITGSLGYEYINQPGESKNSIPYATINMNYNLSKTLSFNGGLESSRTNTLPIANTMNYVDLELKTPSINYAVGQPNYTPGNGFIASVSNLNSLKTMFQNKKINITSFYSNDKQKIFATDFMYPNFAGHKNLTVDYAVISTDNLFAGITLSDNITSKATLCIETTKNFNTQEIGYQITTSYGQTQHKGDADFSVSYRNVQPGAVSQYCIDSNYNDSKAIRIATIYKVTANLTLTAYQDFAQTQNASSEKPESVITFSQNY